MKNKLRRLKIDGQSHYFPIVEVVPDKEPNFISKFWDKFLVFIGWNYRCEKCGCHEAIYYGYYSEKSVCAKCSS